MKGIPQLRNWLGRADQQIVSTALYRLWTVLAGGITIILVPAYLSAEQQGFYFTFVSLLALQIFFELGLNQIIVQLVAKKSAHLENVDWIAIKGSPDARSSIQNIVRLTDRWYLVAAFMFFAVVGICGGIYLYQKLHIGSGYSTIWVLLVAATAANLYLSSRFATLDGLGLVAQVAAVRLRQSFIGYLLMWVGLALGAGLYAMTLMPGIAALYSGAALWSYKHDLLQDEKRGIGDLTWRKDIFPMQWRIALSWVSGYFMFQVFTPAIFKTQGAVEAGKIGIALAGFSAIQSIGMSWITAKVPTFSKLIALGKRQELDHLFDRLLKRSVLFTAATATITVLGIHAANAAGLPVFDRIASTTCLLLLSMVTVVNLTVYAKATYLRSHHEEPMMPVSIVSAILTAGSVFLFAHVGSVAVLLSYLIVALGITLPWTQLIFHRHRRRWNSMGIVTDENKDSAFSLQDILLAPDRKV